MIDVVALNLKPSPLALVRLRVPLHQSSHHHSPSKLVGALMRAWHMAGREPWLIRLPTQNRHQSCLQSEELKVGCLESN